MVNQNYYFMFFYHLYGCNKDVEVVNFRKILESSLST